MRSAFVEQSQIGSGDGLKKIDVFEDVVDDPELTQQNIDAAREEIGCKWRRKNKGNNHKLQLKNKHNKCATNEHRVHRRVKCRSGERMTRKAMVFSKSARISTRHIYKQIRVCMCVYRSLRICAYVCMY